MGGANFSTILADPEFWLSLRISLIFAAVVVPLILPGIATAAIFCFVVSWNEFFYALVLTRQESTTLPVALMSTRTDQGEVWEVMATMGLVIMAPMLLISRLMQRYFVKGITSGGVR